MLKHGEVLTGFKQLVAVGSFADSENVPAKIDQRLASRDKNSAKTGPAAADIRRTLTGGQRLDQVGRRPEGVPQQVIRGSTTGQRAASQDTEKHLCASSHVVGR